MMQIIHCDECGGTNIGLGSVSVNVELTEATHCSKCYQTKSNTTSYFFCSEKCFNRYIKKVYFGEAKFDFKRYDKLTGQRIEPLSSK
jgi:hypothetical protein